GGASARVAPAERRRPSPRDSSLPVEARELGFSIGCRIRGCGRVGSRLLRGLSRLARVRLGALSFALGGVCFARQLARPLRGLPRTSPCLCERASRVRSRHLLSACCSSRLRDDSRECLEPLRLEILRQPPLLEQLPALLGRGRRAERLRDPLERTCADPFPLDDLARSGRELRQRTLLVCARLEEGACILTGNRRELRLGELCARLQQALHVELVLAGELVYHPRRDRRLAKGLDPA